MSQFVRKRKVMAMIRLKLLEYNGNIFATEIIFAGNVLDVSHQFVEVAREVQTALAHSG